MPKRLTAVGVIGALVMMTAASGCGLTLSGGNRTDNGPMMNKSGTAMFIVRPPEKHQSDELDEQGRWWATFGGLELCTDDPDRIPIVDGVRYDVSPTTVVVNPIFRSVPSESERERAGESERTVTWAPMLMLRGRPSNQFNGNTEALGGELGELPTAPLTVECSSSAVEDAYVELITELQIGPDGAWVDKTYVDYHVGDESFTLTIEADLGSCGRVVRDVAGETCDWA